MSHHYWLCLALLGALLILSAACTPQSLPLSVQDLPATRSAAHGGELFTSPISDAPACITCHRLDATAGRGPGLGGYGARAGVQVAGESAEVYTFYSIADPARHLVSGYSNIMFADYANRLSAQEIADLIAFLLGL